MFYLFFFPLIIYSTAFFLLKKNECNTLDKIFTETKFNEKLTNSENLFYLVIFFIFILFNFFSTELPNNKSDIFHEGQLLSGAINLDITNNLWVSSYSNTGIFYDVINTKIAWILTGFQSIGSMRISHLFLESFTSLLLVVFIFNLSEKFNFKEKEETFSFIFLCIISLYLIYDKSITFRYIPLILFFIFSLNILTKPNKNITSSIGVGFLSIFSLLWSLDIGAYLNVTLFFLFVILLILKRYFNIFLIISSILLGWIIFYSIISEKEFYEFLNNSLNIFKYHELLNGIIHPQPFSNEKNATRATKALILVVLNGILLARLILSKENKIPNNTKLFLFLFYVLTFLNYKTGLSRSDSPHIINGTSLSLLLLFVFLNYFIQTYIRNLDNFQKKLVKKRYLSVVLIFSLLIFCIDLKKTSFNNLLSFKARYNNFIQLDDSFYLNENYIKLAGRLNSLLKNQECFQVFTYEPTINYLIKKRSCTKYYNIWSIGSKRNQLDFIQEMKLTEPNYILYEGLYNWDFYPKERFPYINKYLKENYKLEEQFLNWKILSLK